MATKSTTKSKETKTKETKQVEEKNDIQKELMEQLAQIKAMQQDLLKKQKEIDKEKELIQKEKEEMQNTNTQVASNEFIEVICNIPKFEVSDLPAYDLGTKGSTRFIGMPKYGSKASIQYSKLQEILGYMNSGLLEGSVLINKRHKSAIKDLGLSEMYDHIVYPEDMDLFFKKSIEDIEQIVTGSPYRVKNAIASVAKRKMSEGTLDCSVAKLRKLEELIGTKI